MKGNDILRAMSNISDDVIEKNADIKKKNRMSKHAVASIAACLAITVCITSAVLIFRHFLKDVTPPGPSETTDAETEKIPEDTMLFEATYNTSDVKITSKTETSFVTLNSLGGLTHPHARFSVNAVTLTAKAVEDLPDDYMILNKENKYRLIKMKVTDPMMSGMWGEFWYALPSNLYCDLTKYDDLLLSLSQLGNDYVMKNVSDGFLTSFSTVFYGGDKPDYGRILPFTDGIFDESIWENEEWSFIYNYDINYLINLPDNENSYDPMKVRSGMSLEDAKKKIYTAIEQDVDDPTRAWLVRDENFSEKSAIDALASVKPFDKIYLPRYNWESYTYTRYINGCLTNEKVVIDAETEEVTYSKHKFTDEEISALPDIPAYIDSLDLSQLEPQHFSSEEKRKYEMHIGGMYEKTDGGILSIVKITWRYLEDVSTEYIDETFIILTDSGAETVTREQLNELVGHGEYAYKGDYSFGNMLPIE